MEYKEWKEDIIGELTEYIIDYRGKTPKKSSTGIPTLSAKSVKNNWIDYSEAYYISKEEYKRFMVRGFPKVGDVLLTMEAPLGLVATLDRDDVGLAQRIVTMSGKKGTLDNRYFKYYLQSPEGQHELLSRATGTTVVGISQKNLRSVKIKFPRYSTQLKIANILEQYEKKIETNNKIIANLEAQAQALFKYYFVDFEPFRDGKFIDSDLGPIPEGWELSNLEKIANYKNGVAIRKFPPKNNENSLPALKIRELNINSTDDRSDRVGNYIDESVKIYDGDVIFSWSGTLLVKIWTGGNAGLNQHLFKVTSEKYDKWFYYLWTLFHLEKFISIARDKATTMGHIKKSHLKEAKVLICDDNTYKKADAILKPIIDLITDLGIQNQTLAQTRDALLPKLMAGEIDLEGLGGVYD